MIMTATRFSPFRNETDRLQIGGLTVENRLDRICLHGSLDIPRDQEGLVAARKLMDVLSLTMLQLSHTSFPDKTWTGSDH
jgi:hypothetical protein